MSNKKSQCLNLFAASATAAVLAMSVSGISVTVNAAENDFVISGSYISEYTGDGGDIVIPADISGINDFAFYNTAITSVTFEGDIESIGGLAFCGCTSLEKVTFNGGREDVIGFNAFMGCKSLKTLKRWSLPKIPALTVSNAPPLWTAKILRR